MLKGHTRSLHPSTCKDPVASRSHKVLSQNKTLIYIDLIVIIIINIK